jgi:hypothetical protein
VKPFKLMGDLLKTQPRDIVYNLCQYGMGDVWKWGNDADAQSWRTTNDITDTWASVKILLWLRIKLLLTQNPATGTTRICWW